MTDEAPADRRTPERQRWDELVTALQAFLDVIPNDDLPQVLHGTIAFEDKESGGVLRYWPVRMVRGTSNPV